VYGAGSRRHFSWYLEGRSESEMACVDEMKTWLASCQYISDDVLFNERDVWQHPLTFERLKKGDCEDFSLWTWRQLVEKGYDAEFVAGWSIHPGGEYKGHTWVIYKDEGTSYLFDAVARDLDEMAKPLDSVREWYVPQVSVDQQLSQFVYGGYYDRLRAGWLGSPEPPFGQAGG
jgi:hypothetical protein